MAMPSDKQRLRLVTHMCPSLPVELYELLMSYLEDEAGCEATLQYESRAPGPLPGRPDPFTTDAIDLAFMTPTAFVNLVDGGNSDAELLPVTPVFCHAKNPREEKGYYADIIIHKDRSKHVKEFADLRGCRWAYSHEESLSGSLVVLKKLREMGENAAFFGDTVRSGSHLRSLQLVLGKKAEAAAVDANCLAYYRSYLQDWGRDIKVLESIGPLPPYPIVVNKRLSDALKARLVEALLNFSETKFWGGRGEVYGLRKFVPNSAGTYEGVREYKRDVEQPGIGLRYY
ncbi:uncharacterized protein LOC134532621 [Bacillus rossius redtenbacheri]|uniref:uncharacterized protein LOC134532621 n=1 Tax=Bacillus rossius redtenbacheri TaxID=93214 RepID=UPI002FDEC9A5